MEIKHECFRCNKIVTAIVSKVPFKKAKGRFHNRLDCTVCGKSIKFIGENELSKIVTNWKDKIQINNTDERNLNRQLVTLEELGFKLDLIIDHLGIKN